MRDELVSRVTAATGLLTVGLTVVAIGLFASMSPPTENGSAQSVASFFADHHAMMVVALYLAALSLGFNLAFYVGLREVLRRAAPEDEWLGSLGAVAGAVFIAVAFASFAVAMQLAFREGTGDPNTQRTLFDLYGFVLAMTGVPTAVSAVAISAVILRSGVFTRWAAWWGFCVAGLHLVSVGSVAQDGLFSPSVFAGLVAPTGFEIWVLMLSFLLLTSGKGEPARHRA